MNTQNVLTTQQHFKSLSLKLTTTGYNNLESLPDRYDVLNGYAVLKSYTVHFTDGNTTNREINIKLGGFQQISNVNNSTDFITLPISMNGERTTTEYSDIALMVQGNRIPQTIQYSLLDDGIDADSNQGSPANYFHGAPPIAVYLHIQFISPY